MKQLDGADAVAPYFGQEIKRSRRSGTKPITNAIPHIRAIGQQILKARTDYIASVRDVAGYDGK